MNLRENIRLAVAGLIANKMRALLTMLGIIIGIGSVIAIISVGNSVTASVGASMESMGVNNIAIQVYPRDPSGWNYYSDDDLLKQEMIDNFQQRYQDRIEGIGMQEGIGKGDINFRHKNYSVNVMGVNAGFATGATGTPVNLKRGRFITDADSKRVRHVVVISEKLESILFSTGQNPIGQEIQVEMPTTGREIFTVVGVYEEVSNNFMMGMGTSDTTDFYVPIGTAYELENVTPYGFSFFYVAAKSGQDYQKFAQEVADFFNEKYYSKNKDMMIMTQSLDSMVNQVKGTLGSLSMAISVIAAISLLVGGIGVMNIMLVSVTERTREIGIRKALGAPDSAIRIQFIVESIIICSIGGAIGVVVGTGLGYIGGILLKSPTAPSISSIFIAVAFSMFIGIFFGYYPANKAAKLDPIDALRYE